MDILNMVFTGLFTVEMVLKLLALRLRVRNQTHIYLQTSTTGGPEVPTFLIFAFFLAALLHRSLELV